MSFFDLAFDPDPDLSWLDRKISDDLVIFCSCYQTGDDRYTNWGLKDITNGEILIDSIYDSLSYDEVSGIIIGEYDSQVYDDDCEQYIGEHYYVAFDKYGNRLLDEEFDEMIIWGESRLLVKIKEKWGCISLSKLQPVRQYWDQWLSPMAQIKDGTLRSFSFPRKKWEYYDVELDVISDAPLWPDWSQEVSVFEEVGYGFGGSSPRFRRHKKRYPKFIVVTKGAKYGLVQTGFGIRIPIEYEAIVLHAETVWCTKHGKTIKYTRDSLPKAWSSVNQLQDCSKECYLFFDTETTGLPKDYRLPSSAINNWPRLIQLSWIMADKDGFIIKEHDHIIYPEGFMIPRGASLVNGISTEVARKKGEPIKDVLDIFMKDVEDAEFIVGHNVSFDIRVVGAELFRLKKKDTLASKPSICTMQSTIDFCAISGAHGYKYPSLQELHKKLFGYEFEDAHNALSDVRATLKCYLELKRRGVFGDKMK